MAGLEGADGGGFMVVSGSPGTSCLDSEHQQASIVAVLGGIVISAGVPRAHLDEDLRLYQLRSLF